MRCTALFALVLAAPPAGRAWAQVPGEAAARAGAVRAARLSGAIGVDGRLDEPAWQAAPPFSDFVQVFPAEGAPPSERTELRVLYDDRALYLGLRCQDRHPEQIVRPLGRRDAPALSDSVLVVIDANRDRRSAVEFYLSAGGVQADALVYDDDRVTFEWDAVWEGAVAVDAEGWTAELRIPLSALRFPEAAEQAWGFGVIRELGRNRERSASVLLPRSARGLVSRLGTLSGLSGIHPDLDLEITPYLAGRLVYKPPAPDADPARLRPRLLDPVADLGLDFRARVGSSLTLTGAVNPDFGQVEADQLLLNLSTFETFFPEKRPFFTQGLDLFQPPGAGADLRPAHQLFYSRRVGLDAPILGAAKLVGRIDDRWQVGLLDAVVSGSGQRGGTSADTEDRDRGLRWSPAQPFTLAPGDHYPVAAPISQNTFAGVARYRAADGLLLGAQATSALPLGAPCDTDRDPACQARSGHALALDLQATSADSAWFGLGQVTASRVEGPLRRVLADGITLSRGDAGLGAYLRAGRRGGEPWRFEADWAWSSPRLDLNAVGFQRTQNEQELRALLTFTRPSGAGPLHEYAVTLVALQRLSTDGRALDRGQAVALKASALLKDPYLSTDCSLERSGEGWDQRALGTTRGGRFLGNGIPLRRPAWTTLVCGAGSDGTRQVVLDGNAWVSRNEVRRPLDTPWSFGGAANLILQPHPRLQTRLGASLDYTVYALRYLEELSTPSPGGGGRFAFGELAAPALSFTLRQLLVVTPQLTLQLYAQLFTDYQKHARFLQAERGAGDSSPIGFGELRPYQGAAPDLDRQDSQLVLNAVLRWEYRAGSTLYLVYARSQEAGQALEGAFFPRGLRPQGLPQGPTTDSLLVKWSWWIGP